MEEDGVLKYRFYYYLSMAGPPDQETTAIEKIACYTHRCMGLLKRRRHGLGEGGTRRMKGITRVGQEVGGGV